MYNATQAGYPDLVKLAPGGPDHAQSGAYRRICHTFTDNDPSNADVFSSCSCLRSKLLPACPDYTDRAAAYVYRARAVSPDIAADKSLRAGAGLYPGTAGPAGEDLLPGAHGQRFIRSKMLVILANVQQ